MKNYFRVLAFVALVPVMGLAQSAVDADVNAELERLYQEQAQKNAQSAPAQGSGASTPGTQVNVSVQAQPQVTTNQTATQTAPAVVAPAAAATAPQTVMQTAAQEVEVQKQATTLVQSTPLVESKAEALRRARQDAELSTEQTIVEKLEESRMEDERRRAEILFGNKFGEINNKAEAKTEQAAVVTTEINGNNNQITPVVVQEAAPVAVAPVEVKQEEKVDNREAIRSEVTAALAEMKPAQEEVKPEDKTYFSALAGMGEYPDVANVKGQYSVGVSAGRRIKDRILVEGSFQYTNFEVEQIFVQGGCYGYQCFPVITDLNQYNMGLTAKYQLLGGTFRPTVGGTMSYTYRTYADKQFSVGNGTASSHAFDLGLTTGLDLELTPTFALGLDYRYMWNLSYRVDNSLKSSFVSPQVANAYPIEELNYWLLSVVGRVSF